MFYVLTNIVDTSKSFVRKIDLKFIDIKTIKKINKRHYSCDYKYS